jgi:alpha-L-rhamnosidase
LDEQGELSLNNIQLRKPELEFDKETELLLISGRESQITGNLVPTPRQEIEFICSGSVDTYKMAFSIFGFQYAEIETDVKFDVNQFKAIAVYSDMEQTGTFVCSDERVNRFVLNTLWSMKGNFLDIPTDCPTRERLGWTGDAQIFFNTAAYFMNVAPFFRKWMTDIADAQFYDGQSSAVVPYAGADMLYKSTGASVGWNDAVVLIPYRYWKRYGDEQILHDFYDVMKKYAHFMIENTGHREETQANLNPYNQYTYEKGMHLGEWLEPEKFRDSAIGLSVPHPEECTAYLHYTMRHMAEIARYLGKESDEALFAEYAEGAIKAYDWLFLQSGAIDTDRQAKLVRPLALGLLSRDKKRRVQERLVKAVENWAYCIGTGFLSTPFILSVLTESGRADVAYKILENDKSPSWLAEVKEGATTVWENWDGKASRNHYSPGAVCEWLFQTIGGISVVAENRFLIKPIPGGSISHAKTVYTSIYGNISCFWERKEEVYRYTVEIPPNTVAEVILPTGETQTVISGTHVF